LDCADLEDRACSREAVHVDLYFPGFVAERSPMTLNTGPDLSGGCRQLSERRRDRLEAVNTGIRKCSGGEAEKFTSVRTHVEDCFRRTAGHAAPLSQGDHRPRVQAGAAKAPTVGNPQDRAEMLSTAAERDEHTAGPSAHPRPR
jgi:hypothetical protein